MNKEQKEIVQGAMERAYRAIEALELENARNVSGEIASYRAEIEIFQDEKFMGGFVRIPGGGKEGRARGQAKGHQAQVQACVRRFFSRLHATL